ncbi:enoyl-CoA hydratase [Chryseobacterium sp. MYb328]|uniref:enoyl-CoA hydratase n=1 Tax=Chryseobacterium sp. MYb328 TaxID=2745231 RepID=UPI0030A8DC17
MLIIEEVFNLIKQKRSFLGNIKNYKIKISTSNNFERDNLIGIYKIRHFTAIRNKNYKLAKQIEILISNLENYIDHTLKFISISGDKYYGMFYLNQNLDKVIGYLEGEIEENGNILF